MKQHEYVFGDKGRMREKCDEWVVASPAMVKVKEQCARLAPTTVSVVIHGPSGAGKEHVARALHRGSPRCGRPFVAVNAGAIAAGLAESAFFGHERGAFTGAVRRQAGYFERAHGGTLFLDEVAELPLELQAKLLRVLDSGSYVPVGSARTKRVDVRLICATHRDLRSLVHEGHFREDLYYRIAGARVVVPALRHRPEDIGALAAHFVRRLGVDEALKLSADALQTLRLHHWPGNVRELRSVLRLAVLHAQGGVIDGLLVREAIAELSTQMMPVLGLPVEEALRQTRGNVAAAARKLGVPRETLRDRLARRYRGNGSAPTF